MTSKADTLGDELENFSNSLLLKIVEACANAKDKEVSDLTELEKFLVAYVAGVPLDRQRSQGGEFKLKTVPCSIVKTNGKFEVYYKS